MLLGKLRWKTKKATNLWGRGGSEIELEEEQGHLRNHTLKKDTMPA